MVPATDWASTLTPKARERTADIGCMGSATDVLSAAAVGAPPPPKRGAETATALYNYDGADENDLTFKKGDVIEITEKIDEGWWRGTMGGHEGLFPSNYVKVDN